MQATQFLHHGGWNKTVWAEMGTHRGQDLGMGKEGQRGPALDPGRRLTHPARVAEEVTPEVTGSQGQVTPHQDLLESG